MSAWTCRSTDGKAAEIVPPRLRIPYWKGLGADTEEKHEPASDINTEGADSLKALDPKRPIREADIFRAGRHVGFVPNGDMERLAGNEMRPPTEAAISLALGDNSRRDQSSSTDNL